jgi:hypothetical protein
MTEIPADTAALRDATALVVAYLRGDREGIGVILDNCDQRRVVAHLTGMVGGQMAGLLGSRDAAAAAYEARLRELGPRGRDQ